MKRFYYLLMLMALCVVSCNIDDSYDLSNLDSDNLGIGTEDSSFSVPFVEVTLNVEKIITSSTASGFFDTVDNLTCFLPSELSGEYQDGIDLESLSDEEYVDGFVSDLFVEMRTSNDKRVEIFELLKDESNGYASQLTQLDLLGINISVMSAAECAAALAVAFENSMLEGVIENFQAEIVDICVNESESLETNFDVSDLVGQVDLGDDLLDILSKNLDGDKNYIQFMAEPSTNLPFDTNLAVALGYTNQYGVYESLNLCINEFSAGKGIVDNADVLQAIVDSLKVIVNVDMDKYHHIENGLDLSDKYIKLKLHLFKGGSLTL